MRVAVKVCMLASAEAHRDFKREAATLAPLQHPRILRLYGVSHLEGGPVGKVALVLQLAEKGSLDKLIHEGRHEALVPDHDDCSSARGGAARSLPGGWQALPKFNCASSDLETKGLIGSAAQGRLGAVRDALARGARANARLAESGQTALHCASAANVKADAAPVEAGGGPTAVVRFLLSLKGEDAVDATAADERGNTALHFAARAGVLARVEALLPRSDPAARNVEGQTALEALNVRLTQGTVHSPEAARIAALLSFAAPLPLRFVFRSLAGAAEGVAFLHSRGVVHNDLKSANILLDARLEPLVADFGLAKIAHSTLTQTAGGGGKGPLGSMAWMAPEQFSAKSAGYGRAPADVYSLGMVAFELATRTVPWAGLGVPEIVHAVTVERARPLLPADVDAHLAAIIRDCTRDAPEERPSAAEVGVRARALAEGREASADEITSVRMRVAEHKPSHRDSWPSVACAAEAAAARAPAPVPAPPPSSPSQPQVEEAQLQQSIAQLEAMMAANPAFTAAMAPGLKELKDKLAMVALRTQIAHLKKKTREDPGLAAALAPALSLAQTQLADLEKFLADKEESRHWLDVGHEGDETSVEAGALLRFGVEGRWAADGRYVAGRWSRTSTMPGRSFLSFSSSFKITNSYPINEDPAPGSIKVLQRRNVAADAADEAAKRMVGETSTRDRSKALAELGTAGFAPSRAVALLREFAGDLGVCVAAATAMAAAADAGEGEQRLVYTPGRRACVDAGAPAALIALAGCEDVRRSAEAARWISEAVRNIARANEGGAACVAAGAVPALVAISAEPAICGSADAAVSIAGSLSNIARSDVGKAACLAACAVPALVALSALPTVRENADAAQGVAGALGNIATSDAGRDACVSSGAVPALVTLTTAPSVRGSAEAARWVAQALANIATSDAGEAACVAAGAAPALVALSAAPVMHGSAGATEWISQAITKIASSDVGMAAGVAVGAVALVALSAATRSKS